MMPSHGPFRLLLVEDNPGDADIVRERFVAVPDYAFEFTHVTRLQDALNTLDRTPMDFVLLDLNLPDSTGIETLRRLRRVCEDVAIVVLSGNTSEELRTLAYREEAQDIIGKDDPLQHMLARSILYAFERHNDQKKKLNSQKLISAFPDAFIVVGRDGVVQFANQAALALFGTRREDLVSQRLGFSVTKEQTAEIEILRGDERRTAQMR